MDKLSTQDKILRSALQEFTEKGFLNASLRQIVKNAGVTTGAMYRYYQSKEALFEALVKEHADYILNLFNTTIDQFEKMPADSQTDMMYETSSDCIQKMLDYIYEHLDAFHLILEHSEGTSYANFVHQLVEREVESTYTYLETLQTAGYHVKHINRNLIHIIASGLFSAMFETVIHDMPKQEANEYVIQLRRFYSAGWSELFNLDFLKTKQK